MRFEAVGGKFHKKEEERRLWRFEIASIEG